MNDVEGCHWWTEDTFVSLDWFHGRVDAFLEAGVTDNVEGCDSKNDETHKLSPTLVWVE